MSLFNDFCWISTFDGCFGNDLELNNGSFFVLMGLSIPLVLPFKRSVINA